MGLDKLGRSFQYALAGLVYALQTQRNVRIHLIAAIIVLGAGLYFRISSRDFVLLFFAITLVLMAEMFNTALEKAVDLFVQEYSHLAKIAKDAAAGGGACDCPECPCREAMLSSIPGWPALPRALAGPR